MQPHVPAGRETQKQETPGTPQVRAIKPQDAPQVVEFLFAYFLEHQRLAPLNICMDILWTRRFLDMALSNQNVIGFIAENGVILGEVCYTWFGPNMTAKGFLWYVRPEARGGWLAWRLLKAFDKATRERGARYSFQELHNPTHRHIAEKLFHRAGYKDYSASYLKELQ